MTYSERARKLADDAIELVKDHEAREHGGERCQTEPANLLAFIAHALGVHISPDAGEAAIRMFVERVRDYNAVHEEHEHD